jgi:predicted nucleic-acid-binding protein
MIALDTNVLVRIMTADDPEQLKAAQAVMRSGALWVCKTVLLETEWVLRFTYKLPRQTVLDALRKLLGMRSLQVEHRSAAIGALSLYQKGMDFTDALHLTSSTEAERFATFDRRLASSAQVGGPHLPSIELLGA